MAADNSDKMSTNGFQPPADNLVGHRIKECCVQLHASIQKWKQLSEEGLDIASKLANTRFYEKYAQNNIGSAVEECDKLSMEAKIIEERERLFTILREVQQQLETVVEKMGTLTSNVHAAVELLTSYGHCLSQPLFHTLPPAIFSSYFEKVYGAYSQELSLREKMVGDILKQSDRDTITLYLSCWLHEPYIGPESTDSLEALLIDTDLR